MAAPGDCNLLSPLRNRIIEITEKDSVLLSKVMSAYARENGVSPAAGIAALMEFLAGKLEEVHARPAVSAQYAPESELFSRIITHIYRDLDKGVSMKTVASDFHMTTQTLRRIFIRSGCGYTPGALIQELRLNRAQELLRNTRLPIAGIAEKCGFNDPYVFSKAFKRKMKVSPLRYRTSGG